MFYLKRNLTGLERFARLALALCLASLTYTHVPAGWLTIGAYAAAVSTACTAIVGFCPACAMVGRKPIVPGA
jgi:hypothetical protein